MGRSESSSQNLAFLLRDFQESADHFFGAEGRTPLQSTSGIALWIHGTYIHIQFLHFFLCLESYLKQFWNWVWL